jgi:hypothetical protein
MYSIHKSVNINSLFNVLLIDLIGDFIYIFSAPVQTKSYAYSGFALVTPLEIYNVFFFVPPQAKYVQFIKTSQNCGLLPVSMAQVVSCENVVPS